MAKLDHNFGKFIKVNHWLEAFTDEWKSRWPNFEPWEFATRDGSLKISTELLDKLQELRTRFGDALNINCGYRDKLHNAEVGGGEFSQHLYGTAVDIHIKSITMGRRLEQLALEIGFTAVGRYNGVNTKGRFIHLDVRKRKKGHRPDRIYQWGSWNIRR